MHGDLATYVQRDVRQVVNVTDLDALTTLLRLAAGRTGGAVFESWVAAEALKARVHRRLASDLFHLRETRGLEVDLIVEAGDRVIGVEVKSGATVSSDVVAALHGWPGPGAEGRVAARRIVYGGNTRQERTDVDVVPWAEIQDVAWV